MSSLPASLRYAFRRWRHRPGLANPTTLVLALGIGATTAMFSIVNAVLLKEEPWPDADRLVRRMFSQSPQVRWPRRRSFRRWFLRGAPTASIPR